MNGRDKLADSSPSDILLNHIVAAMTTDYQGLDELLNSDANRDCNKEHLVDQVMPYHEVMDWRQTAECLWKDPYLAECVTDGQGPPCCTVAPAQDLASKCTLADSYCIAGGGQSS